MTDSPRPWGLLAEYAAEIRRLRALLDRVRNARTLSEAKQAASR